MSRELLEAAEAEAQSELDAEYYRGLVADAKDKLIERSGWPWYRRLFPYRIHLERIK